MLQVRDRRGAARLRRPEGDPRVARRRSATRRRRASTAAPAIIREFAIAGDAPAAGVEVTVDIFAAGELVKVTGTSKGRGFQGVVHRHGFHGGPATHGNTRHRKPGSISPGTDPSRVIKGKKMPGHHGAAKHTELGLTVVKIDADRNLLFVKGAVPGARNGIVTVREAGRSEPPCLRLPITRRPARSARERSRCPSRCSTAP